MKKLRDGEVTAQPTAVSIGSFQPNAGGSSAKSISKDDKTGSGPEIDFNKPVRRPAE